MGASKILYNCVYVVVMNRWGAEESHHYIMGVFEDLEEAKRIAAEEREYRGGKYEWVIEAYSLNKSRRNCPMGKKLFRVARSEEMTVLTDKERGIALKGEDMTREFKEYMAKKDIAKLKEDHTQLTEDIERLRNENIKLREKLNEKK